MIFRGFTETKTPVNKASSCFRTPMSHPDRPQKFLSAQLTETHFFCSKHPSAEKMDEERIRLHNDLLITPYIHVIHSV